LTWRELETWLWLPDCGPARKCLNHHRRLRRARQFSTLPGRGSGCNSPGLLTSRRGRGEVCLHCTHGDGYSISRLCRVLGVSRGGYCQWRKRPPSPRAQGNAALDAEVAAIHQTRHRSYGRPRIVAQLRLQGKRIGSERVRRSLQRQGLRAVYKRPYRVTTDSNHRLLVVPNMLQRRFDGWSANQAWVSDIPFIATAEGWLYLAAILDLASHRIVGWLMSERINAELVCQGLRSACWQRRPPSGLILYSD
jgi:putative transposase